jgi:hypothetical protein
VFDSHPVDRPLCFRFYARVLVHLHRFLNPSRKVTCPWYSSMFISPDFFMVVSPWLTRHPEDGGFVSQKSLLTFIGMYGVIS